MGVGAAASMNDQRVNDFDVTIRALEPTVTEINLSAILHRVANSATGDQRAH